MTADLQAILGDRYGAVIEEAEQAIHDAICDFHSGDGDTGHCEAEYRAQVDAPPALAAVLPGLLADAWDECSLAWQEYYSGRTDSVPPDNPYRTETP